jgi:thiol-disulfide isomerase/thioredoxin
MKSRLYAAVSIFGLSIFGLASPAFSGERPQSVSRLELADAAANAPEFTGISAWFNSAPLRLSDLRGKVVLVNFWTYGCINCVHTLPHFAELQRKYKDKGLVIIGVHTPEFAFEKSASNVQTALKRNNIEYPVAQDNNSATWNAYNNHYWPAQYVIDQRGKIVFQHDGEGQYEQIDQTIRHLLETNG